MSVWEAVAQAGPWGLIAFVVLAILRGWLVPLRWHERQVAQMEKRIEDHKETGAIWKEIAEERRVQIATLMGHVKEPMP